MDSLGSRLLAVVAGTTMVVVLLFLLGQLATQEQHYALSQEDWRQRIETLQKDLLDASARIRALEQERDQQVASLADVRQALTQSQRAHRLATQELAQLQQDRAKLLKQVADQDAGTDAHRLVTTRIAPVECSTE